MISERAKALLQAAATIYAGYVSRPGAWNEEAYANAKQAAHHAAYTLLDLIEAREKANAPTSKPLPCRHERLDPANCPWCREVL